MADYSRISRRRCISLSQLMTAVRRATNDSATLGEITDGLADDWPQEVPVFGGNTNGVPQRISKSAVDFLIESFNRQWWDGGKISTDPTASSPDDLLVIKSDAEKIWRLLCERFELPPDLALSDYLNSDEHPATEAYTPDDKPSRSPIENELEHIKQKVKEALTQLRERDSKQFLRLICEALTAKNGTPEELVQATGGLHRLYRDLAEIVLQKMEWREKGSGAPTITFQGCDYTSIRDYIAAQLPDPYPIEHSPRNDPATLEDFCSLSMQHLEEDFSHAINCATRLIFEGVPIYREIPGNANPMLVSPNDPTAIFLQYLGRYRPDIRTGLFPEWLQGLFFRQDHIAAHKLFFSQSHDLDGDQFVRVKTAFEQSIGVSPTSGSVPSTSRSVGTISPTLVRLNQAIAAFPETYPEFRSRPPKLEEDVRAWLKDSQIASSAREAHVFGTVLAEMFELR